MPNIESAAKRMRQAVVRREKNRAVTSKILTLRRQFLVAVESGDKAKAETAYRAFCSAADKARKVGVIKDNTADRKKARGAALLAKMK
jgi:small subunit ribosomal protein S20